MSLVHGGESGMWALRAGGLAGWWWHKDMGAGKPVEGVRAWWA